MTSRMMLATLALAAATARATDTTAAPATDSAADLKKCDNEGKNNGLWKFKPNLEDRWCHTDIGVYDSCGTQCCEVTDVCVSKFHSKTPKCKDRDGDYDAAKKSGGDDYGYDTAKDKTPWMPKTADVDCCAKKNTCTSANFQCGSTTVWKKTSAYETESATGAGRSTNYCSKMGAGLDKNKADEGGTDTCTKMKCCEVVTETCAGHFAARTDKDSGKDMMKCPDGYHYDSAVKGSTEVTNGEFNAGKWKETKTQGKDSGKCCTPKKTCLGEYYRRKWNNKVDTNGDPTNDLLDDDDLSCEVDSYVPKAKYDTTVAEGIALASFRTTCCKPLKKCSALTCNETLALVANQNQDDKLCKEEEGSAEFDQDGKMVGGGAMMCNLHDIKGNRGAIGGCCKADPKKCRGYQQPSHGHEELACSKFDHEFADIKPYEYRDEVNNKTVLHMGKSNNLVENDEAYKTQCCTKKMRCVVYKDPSKKIVATTSAANSRTTQAIALFFMAFGVIAVIR